MEAQRCIVQLQLYANLLPDDRLGLPLGFLGSTITMLVIAERSL